MLVRKATTDDVSLLTDIIRNSFRDVAARFHLTPENCPTHPSNCIDEWISTALIKGLIFYILENEDLPCGCVALEFKDLEKCYLKRLAVLPEYRRRGFGEALVKRVLEEASKQKTRRVEIGVIAGHQELVEWYGKLGFSIKETVHFDHLPFDVAVMSIQL